VLAKAVLPPRSAPRSKTLARGREFFDANEPQTMGWASLYRYPDRQGGFFPRGPDRLEALSYLDEHRR
jgi:hypothetical protein